MEFQPESSFRLPRGFVYLCVVREGKLEVKLGWKVATIGGGDVLLLNTEGSLQAQFVAATAGHLQVLPVKAECFYPLFSGAELSVLQSFLSLCRSCIVHPTGTPVARLCAELFARLDGEMGMLQRADVLALFAKALPKSAKSNQGERRGPEKLLEVLPGLNANDLMTLPVGQLASRYHVSRRQLSRIFQEHFGISAATVKMEIRLIQAVRLLRDRDLKVIEVAERTGFNHLGLFNTCFKRRFGMSPTRYRASLKARVIVDAALEVCPMRDAGLCAWMSERNVL